MEAQISAIRREFRALGQEIERRLPRSEKRAVALRSLKAAFERTVEALEDSIG